MEIADVYEPSGYMSYMLAVSVIETLAREKGFSEREKTRLLDLLRKRYGLKKSSIFAK